MMLTTSIFATAHRTNAFTYHFQTQTLSQKINNLVTVVVNPSGDAWLNEYRKNRNYGGDTKLVVQSYIFNRHVILKFDLTGLPSHIKVVSANLSLYYYNRGFRNPAGRTYYCYRLTETDWVEGTQSGSKEAGSCCWNYRQYDTLAWTVKGGTYTTENRASATVPSSFGWMVWNVTNQVQYAIDNTGKIVHFIIIDGNEYSIIKYRAYFYSREYSNHSLIPKLEVTYKLAN
ncbi:DNRLRE domain-containing protein [Candidatus Bathyarchaeota archaeon]|nr:DNRLRE domain-containing protein [Candidatus Bathyarchaeota archaeon]